MAKRVSYKSKIMGMTGMTSAQYERAYGKFASQVRNYNKVAGTNYKAAREFYYSFKYAGMESPALQAIKSTKASHGHFSGEVIPLGKKSLSETEKAVYSVVKARWEPFALQSQAELENGGSGDAWRVFEMMKNGQITPKEADMLLAKIKKDIPNRSSKDASYKY
jgi:hypothetical protein